MVFTVPIEMFCKLEKASLQQQLFRRDSFYYILVGGKHRFPVDSAKENTQFDIKLHILLRFIAKVHPFILQNVFGTVYVGTNMAFVNYK